VAEISKTIVSLLSSSSSSQPHAEDQETHSLFVYQSNSAFDSDYSRAMSNIPHNIMSIFYSLAHSDEQMQDGDKAHININTNHNRIDDIVYGMPNILHSVPQGGDDENDDEDEF
jgi:hypothetical protein